MTYVKMYPRKFSEICNSQKYIPRNFPKCYIRENNSIKFLAKISTTKVYFSMKDRFYVFLLAFERFFIYK